MEPATVAEAIRERARRRPDRPFLRLDDRTVSWRQYLDLCIAHANMLLEVRRAGAPFHVGILADNVPEWLYALGGCALSGATAVGLNPTRRGAELRGDARHTECVVVVGAPDLLVHLDDAIPTIAIGDELDRALAGVSGKPDPAIDPDADDTALLLFTSGTTSAPKAVIRSHGSAVRNATRMADRIGVSHADCGYVCMPVFHGGALVSVVLPAILRGASLCMRERFSVRRFLPDVRRHGATWFGYTGKPLAYLLTTPEQDDDADNTLRVAIGNEGNSGTCDAFAARYGCTVIDFYGSTEGGVGMVRETGDPRGSLGRPAPGVKVLAADGSECPAAVVDGNGRIVNADEAIGEIVNTTGLQTFEGYWRNPEATEARSRGGRYHSGDLAWRDRDGFLYFAGRTDDWVRVDGENLSAGTIERLLEQHPDVLVAAVVGVPDVDAGDQILAVLETRPGTALSPESVLDWLEAQPDCGTKWLPRYVRIVGEMPLGATHKVDRRRLRREWLDSPETLERCDAGLVRLDAPALRGRFATSGRAHLLDM